MNDESEFIVFFDDECLVCNSTVRFLLAVDKKEKLHFAAIGGTTSRLEGYNFPQIIDKTSIVFYKAGIHYSASTAIMELFRYLGGGWYLLYVMIKLIPIKIRDRCYFLFAQNRHLIGGKRDHCSVLRKEWRSRFLT